MGEQGWSSAANGYHIEDDFCVINVCKCGNGNPVKGVACSVNGANECESCSDGFHLNGLMCNENICSCVSRNR